MESKALYRAPETMVTQIGRQVMVCQSPTGTAGNPSYSGFEPEEQTW